MVENKQKYNLINKNISLKKGKDHITKLVIDNLNRNICTKKKTLKAGERNSQLRISDLGKNESLLYLGYLMIFFVALF